MNNPHVEMNQTDTSSASTKKHDETELEPNVSTDGKTHATDTNKHTDKEEANDAASGDDDNEHKDADLDDVQDDKKADEEVKVTTDETNTDTQEDKPSPENTSVATPPTPTVSNKSEGVCWICYETLHEGQANDATDTVIRPCKCKGTLGGVHQECLLAWMAQTNATTCPHCNYAYDLEEQYPSTLQSVCDHPWLPTCMSAIICATLFYLFHRIWRRFTRSKTNHSRKNPSMSSARFLSMMGGGLPSPFMMPQMNDIMGTASSTLFQKPSFNLSSIIAEIELFALSVMILYSIARYTHQYCSPQTRSTVSNLSSEDTEVPSETPTYLRYLNSFSTDLHTFWSLVDDIWAQRASGNGQLNQDEAFYMMPFDILTTLFYVIQHACKQTQQWAVNKTMVVRTYEPTSNTPGLSVH